MSLKVYTQEEVKAIKPDENGRRYFPTGNYSFIEKFPAFCSFGKDCIFGNFTKFKKECKFEEGCIFGLYCKFSDYTVFYKKCSFNFQQHFGDYSSFGEDCKFEVGCWFGSHNLFGHRCSFGSDSHFENTVTFGNFTSFGFRCDFGKGCTFGEVCKFAAWCVFGFNSFFGKDCKLESKFLAKNNKPFIVLSDYEKDKFPIYIFNFVEGLYVRKGSFFGTIEAFRQQTIENEKTPHSPSKITKVYLGFCDLAEAQFS